MNYDYVFKNCKYVNIEIISKVKFILKIIKILRNKVNYLIGLIVLIKWINIKLFWKYEFWYKFVCKYVYFYCVLDIVVFYFDRYFIKMLFKFNWIIDLFKLYIFGNLMWFY